MTIKASTPSDEQARDSGQHQAEKELQERTSSTRKNFKLYVPSFTCVTGGNEKRKLPLLVRAWENPWQEHGKMSPVLPPYHRQL